MPLMMLSNLHPDTTDEDVLAFLQRYGFPAYDEIERHEGDGTRPAVMLTYASMRLATLHQLQPRIHGVFWNGHKINALILRERFQ
ncbi:MULTISPECIES: RNA-binding protein [Cupriavidus]|uniref:RNA-binding protein n=1 Tax=Cupriavidus pauculus TaxID=82633 RepID=A0A5P2HAH4_9BURK|nr:RNA-binding protein [Cupriavidus pauculus]QET04453.1 RNA-binding protein [Cupriavidus pauculus]